MVPVTRRQFIQDSFALAMFGCTGAILTACGQPNPSPGAGRAPAPGTPARTATVGPDTQETPIPVPFTGVTATTGYPTPEPRPPADTAVPYLPQNMRTPRPEDPYQVVSNAHTSPNTAIETNGSQLVVRGTITRINPARWTTVDGKRPANPHVQPPQYTIYRPIFMNVEQRIKGETPDRQLALYVPGGEIGQDFVRRSPDTLWEFSEGENVVLFLYGTQENQPRTSEGQPLWQVGQHYTLTADGQAKNYYQTVPVQQLLDEIMAAQKSR